MFILAFVLLSTSIYYHQFRVQSLEQEVELLQGEKQRNLAELTSLQETAANDRRAKVIRGKF
jgi:hypothetical protein